MNRNVGLAVVAIGVGVVVIGALIWVGALSWFGRLPGDVRIEGERTRVYVPIVSMIVASVLLTVVINLLLRWWR